MSVTSPFSQLTSLIKKSDKKVAFLCQFVIAFKARCCNGEAECLYLSVLNFFERDAMKKIMLILSMLFAVSTAIAAVEGGAAGGGAAGGTAATGAAAGGIATGTIVAVAVGVAVAAAAVSSNNNNTIVGTPGTP